MRRWTANACPLAVLVVVGVSLGLGCAGLVVSRGLQFDYFELPKPADEWSSKIASWQWRELAEPVVVLAGLQSARHAASAAFPPSAAKDVALGATSTVPDLREKYSRYLAERKYRVARDFASWVQEQAKVHYVADGPIDQWATLAQTLRANGDDCDGLELLSFQGLRELGFRDDEVFRAIVFRPSDGQHHMVTLWFEKQDDPWVIDPTGAMTAGMPRMSELPNWVPLKVFSETVEFTVRAGTAQFAVNR
jgi:predicted transglutaminase-like cysteine proteinase